MLAWLEEQGCEWEKVCAEPGDLILVHPFLVPFYCISLADTLVFL